MNQPMKSVPVSDPAAALKAKIVELAQTASIELNVQDVKHLPTAQTLLRPGTKVYVSHLPKQRWEDTAAAARAVLDAGFDAVPHIPVRLLESAETLDRVVASLAGVGVREVLLISGDYPQAVGPYSMVVDVVRSGVLQKHGILRASLAAHPEGHPQVELGEVRRSEVEKAEVAMAAGLEASLVTQLVFEPTPFLEWVGTTRGRGVRTRIMGGVAGPASLATLFKFAMRCGVGPSIRALGARPGFAKLLGDRGPEEVVRPYAEALIAGDVQFDGIHVFCFGGFLRACRWLQAVGEGRFDLDDGNGFKILD